MVRKQSAPTDEAIWLDAFDSAYRGGVVDVSRDGLRVYRSGWWHGAVCRGMARSGLIPESRVLDVRAQNLREASARDYKC